MNARTLKPRMVTITLSRDEAWDAHSARYRDRSEEFPEGHLGGAFCPCELARQLRAAEGMGEMTPQEVEEHRRRVEGKRRWERERPASGPQGQGGEAQ